MGVDGRMIVSHKTYLCSIADNLIIPVLVWTVNEDSGTAIAFAPQLEADFPSHVLFEFRIGYFGAFNFGSLDPVWCPAKILRINADMDLGETVPIQIEFDRTAQEFCFFHWYCADWSVY